MDKVPFMLPLSAPLSSSLSMVWCPWLCFQVLRVLRWFTGVKLIYEDLDGD